MERHKASVWPLVVLFSVLVVYSVLSAALSQEMMMYAVVIPVMIGLAWLIARLTRFRYGGPLPGSMHDWFVQKEGKKEQENE